MFVVAGFYNDAAPTVLRAEADAGKNPMLAERTSIPAKAARRETAACPKWFFVHN